MDLMENQLFRRNQQKGATSKRRLVIQFNSLEELIVI